MRLYNIIIQAILQISQIAYAPTWCPLVFLAALEIVPVRVNIRLKLNTWPCVLYCLGKINDFSFFFFFLKNGAPPNLRRVLCHERNQTLPISLRDLGNQLENGSMLVPSVTNSYMHYRRVLKIALVLAQDEANFWSSVNPRFHRSPNLTGRINSLLLWVLFWYRVLHHWTTIRMANRKESIARLQASRIG